MAAANLFTSAEALHQELLLLISPSLLIWLSWYEWCHRLQFPSTNLLLCRPGEFDHNKSREPTWKRKSCLFWISGRNQLQSKDLPAKWGVSACGEISTCNWDRQWRGSRGRPAVSLWGRDRLFWYPRFLLMSGRNRMSICRGLGVFWPITPVGEFLHNQDLSAPGETVTALSKFSSPDDSGLQAVRDRQRHSDRLDLCADESILPLPHRTLPTWFHRGALGRRCQGGYNILLCSREEEVITE